MDALFVAGSAANPGAGATSYAPIHGTINTWATTESQASQVIPHTLVLDQFHAQVAVAAGSLKSHVFTVMKNGSATALTCTITGTSQLTAKDDTVGHAVTFNAGDTISIRDVTTSGIANAAGVSFSARQVASTSGQYAVLFGDSTAITTTTFGPPIEGAFSTTENQCEGLFPVAVTIKNLYVKCSVDPTPGNWTITARKNGADTSAALTCNIAAGQAAGNDSVSRVSSDTTNQPTFAAGDRVCFHVVAAASPAVASRIAGGFTVVPGDGTTAALMHSYQSVAATGNPGTTNYGFPNGCRGTYQTAEVVGLPLLAMQAMTLTAMYVRLSATTGAAKTYTATVRKNGTTDTAVTVAITNAQIGNITGQAVAIALDDTLDMSVNSSGTPTAAHFHLGIGYTMTPPIITVPPDAIAGVATVSVTRVARTRTLWNTIG